MLGQLDTVGHPEEGDLGLLLVMAVLMATVIAPAAAADDIVLVPLMTGIGNARLVVLLVDLQFGKHVPWSL
jgi:hypothetical protein